MAAQIFEDFACKLCGCVCDDLRLTVDGGRIVDVDRGCAAAKAWLLAQDSVAPPAAEINSQSATLDNALQRAGEILAAARYPLVWGLSRSSVPGQRAAIALAEAIGATIDTTASLDGVAALLAMQQVGQSTCTLGEVRERADLVIYWGADPVVTHPRHLERFVMPAGRFVPGGRGDRTLIVIGEQPNASSRLADEFIAIEPAENHEAVTALRLALAGQAPGVPPRASQAALAQLLEHMKSCRTGVIFFGPELTQGETAHRTIEALLRLVRDLNAHARFYASPLRGDVSAENVLAWQTGFPLAVNFSRGYPRFDPTEFTASAVLERGEADAVVLVGSEAAPRLSSRARAHLARTPTIVLDHPTVASTVPATVRFTTAVDGVHLPGTAYRMDDVPLPLRAVLAAHYASDEEVLTKLLQIVAANLKHRTIAL